MKLKEIHRTSTFAWSPTADLPLLATGTVAGALDESFSNESQLEIWAPNFLDRDEFVLGADAQHGPRGYVTDTARFNRLAWGSVDAAHPRGVIAAGLENGELALWDPAKILAGADVSESLILRNTTHTGPVRGLDFNPIQTNLLASGGINGEVYIWDLKDPSKPYSPTPGARSTKLDEITSVAWNQQVQYVLAGASSTGYTVVWDLRGKREVVALAYGGGAGTLAGQVGSGSGLAVGGRRGMSDIAWHPDNATRVVTASEDDSSPIIMVWDLRNARAPEKILTGHEKGVLSLSWCKQDADLLLSCGKDNRALCWNPQTSEIIGELPSADNWAFQVDWCPKNPDLLATAFFDGTVGIHSIQSTNDFDTSRSVGAAGEQPEGADIFDVHGGSSQPQQIGGGGGTLSLKQPPKWLRRPTSNSFGFGGKLVTVSNLPGALGKNQSSVVHVRKIVTEQGVVERAKKLGSAIEGDTLKEFAEERTVTVGDGTGAGWKALLSLFKADSRDELVTLLGFSKEEVAARVAEAVENLKAAAERTNAEEQGEDEDEDDDRKPVVSFAEPERQELTVTTSYESDGGNEKTPSEVSGASVTSDATRQADAESTTTTAPSLFGDEVGPGALQDAGSDFFSAVIAQGSNDVLIPHTNYGLDSSVAATIGSGPSSVTSEILKNNTFRIYPADESETDRLVTKALVLGDFESAVSLCLSSDRFADALLLAVRGGPELLQRTQKAYFERRTTALPYLRLFQSIVTNDLSDIVQNADLQEWQEIFVVLCTFAAPEEFSGLAEQLGSRLEFQFTVSRGSEDESAKAAASGYRRNATLTYLAAARLERLVGIWIDEMAEEEKALLRAEDVAGGGSRYSAHAHALQTFIEKVVVFRAATRYEDSDLGQRTTGAETYKLAGLYDRYFEYAELLTTQGLVTEAVRFLKLMPADYKGSGSVDLSVERERLIAATGATAVAAAPAPIAQAPTVLPPVTPAYPSGYGPTYTNAPQITQIQPNPYAVPNYPSGTYNPPASLNPPAPQNNNWYTPPQIQSTVVVPPPPRPMNGANTNLPPPPPKKQDNGGWNDAPVVPPVGRAPPPASVNKLAAITSPFPNATPSPGFSPAVSPYTQPGQNPATIPPPPRPGSVARGGPPPPPPQGSRIQGPPQPGPGGMHPRPPSAAPQNAGPPSRLMSPAQSTVPPRQPTPSQYAPPVRGPVQGQNPVMPGPGRPPGPPGQQPHGQALVQNTYGHAATPPPGPYGPPPGQQQQHQQPPPPGPYGPPQGMQRGGPPQLPAQVGGAPPPPPPGGPPRAGSSAAQPSRPQPKYPPGDRSHIPEAARPAFSVISEQLNRMRQTSPQNQKRLVDDLERRISPLFDALNCETLSKPVVEQLLVLTRAMEAHDRPAALAIHVDLLTRGSQTDDIGLWMSGVKQLIMRL